MFSKLIAGWNQDNLIKVAYSETNTMIKKSELMFCAVSDLFLKNKELSFDIYTVDKEINRGEIAVRRKVLEHLALNPRQDLVFSLVLSTIINDVERVGDYSKNIYELSQIYGTCIDLPPHSDRLTEATEKVKEMFSMTIHAFDKEDQEQAEQVLRQHGEINRTCESVMREVANDEEMNTKNAVTLVLYARYLKRVSAHLANLMTSVVRPYDRIGYFRDQTNQEVDLEG